MSAQKIRSLIRLIRLIAIVALGWTCAACATIVGGTTQDLSVETDPAGAECKIDRQGSTVGVVKVTPGKTSIPRHKDNISVGCSRPGYEPTTQVLSSSFSGMTLGNILVGGLVGVVIDASSGANNQYPGKVTMTLTPSTFPNEAARDEYYAGVVSRLNATTDTEIKRINDSCAADKREVCQKQVGEIEEARTRNLAEIEARRQAAKVGQVA